MRRLRPLGELLVIVAGALFFALAIQAYAFRPYLIPSESMAPTLQVGQRVIVDRFSHRVGGDPKLNDITVFMPPRGSDVGQCGVAGEGPYYSGRLSGRSCERPTVGTGPEPYIKRVVGMPGDRIAVRDGHVIRNGRRAIEPFAVRCGGLPACDLDEIVIPAGHYFLMGDNRGRSVDSRYWGPVPRRAIIGHAIVTFWPPGRVGGT
jgi:signal peptidase I